MRKLVLLLTAVMFFLGGGHAYAETYNMAHAGGGIGGYKYVNSVDAMESNYRKGHRLFEVDLVTTADKDVYHQVLRHGWTSRLGQKYYYGTKTTYKQFLASPIYGKYKPTTVRYLIRWMKAHPDATIILDPKGTTNATLRRQHNNIKNVAKSEGALYVLDRMIPQLYNESMKAEIDKEWTWKAYIYTLYRTDATDQEVLDYVDRAGIDIVTMSTTRYSQPLVTALKIRGVEVYVHTINDPAVEDSYRAKGVSGVVTDFLAPY